LIPPFTPSVARKVLASCNAGQQVKHAVILPVIKAGKLVTPSLAKWMRERSRGRKFKSRKA
jgi:hypothetical protein